MHILLTTTNKANSSWFQNGSLQLEPILDKLVSFGLNVLICLLILVIGLFLISWVLKLVKAAFKRSKIEATAASFLESLISISLKGILLITIILQLGVKESSILALLGTIGLAIGMALQGSLSNFAGGVLILILKPFKVGDYIEVQGVAGKVEKILVFNSRLTTNDNKTITIPNGTLANSIVTNYTHKAQRRVDITFTVSYDSDINQVRSLLANMLQAHPKILKNPEPFLRLNEQAASSLNFVSRAWVKTEDYWDVYFDLMEESKHILDQAGIEIPYNKLDLNILTHKKED